MLAGMCIQRQKIFSYNCDVFNQIKGLVTERDVCRRCDNILGMGEDRDLVATHH